MVYRYDKWSLEEKKQLAQLLEVYPLGAYKAIAKRIGTKSAEEVQTFMEKMKYSAMTYTETKPVEKKVSETPRAPLEEWIDICFGLTEREPFDTSSQLSKVMSVIAHLEDFPQSDKHPPVDYQSIYRYLSQILQTNRQDDVDQLRPLECAVLLDVIHSLMDVLSGTDTTVQRNIMKWKCELMDARDIHGHTLPENLKIAAENEFSEFIKKEEEKWTERIQRFKEEPKSIIYKHTTVESQRSSTSGGSVSARTEDPNMVSITTPAGKVCTYEQSWKHRPGRKRKEGPEETPITDIVVVLPPKNAKIINYTPRAKTSRKERKDGKYQALDSRKKITGIVNESCREVSTQESNEDEEDAAEEDPHMNVSSSMVTEAGRTNEGNLDTAVEIRNTEGTSVDVESEAQTTKGKQRLKEKLKQRQRAVDAASKVFEEQKKKYKKMEESAAKASKKKPKLYTLNPLNIPVCLLDLDS